MLQLYRLQDIQLADVNLKEQYYNTFLSGDIDGAKNIVTANPQLKTKVLNASNLNNIVNNVLNIEQYYYTDFEFKMAEELVNFQLSIDELIYTTLYNDGLQYEINNIVSYNDELYFCILKPLIGTLPTNTTYWLYLGLKGDKGVPSLSVNYVGNWSSLVTYNQYDMVVYDNKLYISKNTNVNSIPSGSTTNWYMAMQTIQKGIYVSPSGAQGTTIGDIWMEILGWTYNSSETKENVHVSNVTPSDTDIGNVWFETINAYNQTTNNLYISATTPITSLAVGDIWVEIPEWVLGETTTKGIYIAGYYPDNMETGRLWLEIKYS